MYYKRAQANRRGLVGRVGISGQSSKKKYEKYFFGDYLSADFWQKL